MKTYGKDNLSSTGVLHAIWLAKYKQTGDIKFKERADKILLDLLAG